MGGDKAPQMVVEGVAAAAERLSDTDFLIFGDEARLAPLVARFPNLAGIARIRHTSEVVSDAEKPSVALRGGRNSSMRLAIDAVARGEAAGVVSAGNTGALMAMAKFVLKMLPGIDRPAIAGCFPTERGESVMLDLGANVECDADNLVQFAVMGEVFARHVLGIKDPSIGILNVGVEDLKGNEAVKKAAAILKEVDLPIRFYGFIEGDDIGEGTVDVIVTDGFTGNIALKTAEGIVKLFSQLLKQALMNTPLSRFAALLARPALNAVKAKIDPRRYNGALFVGLNGICIKSHGGTDAIGFANAINVAHELVVDRLNEGIKADIAHLAANNGQISGAAANL
jgi:glycerol-3-phosphate acyltransferase PlsX